MKLSKYYRTANDVGGMKMNFKRTLSIVDTHSGEPARVIIGGIPKIPGKSVYEKLRWLEKNDDQVRNLVLKEPRGYPPVCADLIVPPGNENADAGFIIMEQDQYPLMSGSNVISVTTALLETGMIPMVEPLTEITLEAAAGLIKVKATCENGKVTKVTFDNVPSYAEYLDVEINVPNIGTVTVDVAWGGAWFVIIDASQFDGIALDAENACELMKIASLTLKAAQEQLAVSHPEFPEEIIMIPKIVSYESTGEADSISIVVNTTSEVRYDDPATWHGILDRSACGTGISAEMAVLYAKGKIKKGDIHKCKNLIGITYSGEVKEITTIGNKTAIIPEISGTAWITGFYSTVLDPTDPFPNGFTVADIW